MKRLGVALFLAQAACTPAQHAEGEVSEEADGVSVIYTPEQGKYPHEIGAKVELPEEYVWPEGSASGRSGDVKPINYRTGEPSSDTSSRNPDIIGIFAISVDYYKGDSGIHQFYEGFDDIGEMRYGLSYRPDPVPSRPEALWKRVYMKPGVSGEDFSISCIPPMGPGTIAAPTECTMNLMLAPRQDGDRRAGLSVRASVPVSRLEDWRKIERVVVDLIEPRITWIEAIES